MAIFDLIANQLASRLASQASAEISGLATNQLRNLLGLGDSGPLPSMFNIDEFRTNLSAHGELAKSDKFNVVIMVPDVIQKASGVTLKELTLQCESAELPSRDINLIEYRHYGFIKRIPHQNQYGQATFTFICTGDMWEKRLFDRWLDVMVPSNSGLVTYMLDPQGNSLYEAPIFINQFNANGQVIYTAQLIDAIPTSISPLSLDWSGDQPHKLVVTFNFRKWLSDATTASVPTTDFGRAVGGNVTLAPAAASPINNQTNNTGNPAIKFFGQVAGTAAGASLAAFKIKL
jgi:hypothetical protein